MLSIKHAIFSSNFIIVGHEKIQRGWRERKRICKNYVKRKTAENASFILFFYYTTLKVCGVEVSERTEETSFTKTILLHAVCDSQCYKNLADFYHTFHSALYFPSCRHRRQQCIFILFYCVYVCLYV